MNRRAAAPATLRLLAGLFVALAVLIAGTEPAAASTPPPDPPPPVTANDFIPDDQNLTDCIGVLEKPGCGSKERGGWRQTAVFLVMAGGLGLVFWRIVVGVRRNRAGPPAAGAG